MKAVPARGRKRKTVPGGGPPRIYVSLAARPGETKAQWHARIENEVFPVVFDFLEENLADQDRHRQVAPRRQQRHATTHRNQKRKP